VKTKQCRWRIYRTHKSHEFLCIVSATSAADALRIARQTWVLPREAFAMQETFTLQG
jgi:hypothetical protein